MTFKTLGLSLIGIFVPIYLYKLGFSISLVIGYFLVREVIELFLVVPTSHIVARIGTRKALIFGSALTLVNLYLLFLLPQLHVLFFLAAISEGAAISIFFIPYHLIFSAAVSKRSGGTELSYMDILTNLAAALGPLIGGFVASQYGLRIVIILAIGFVLLALEPLIRDSPRVVSYNFVLSRPRFSGWWRDLVSSAGFGITEMSATIIWPLFIYFAVKTYAAIGLIVSISLILTIALAYGAGRLSDRGKDKQLLNAGAGLSAGVHAIRIIGASLSGITLLNIAGDAAHSLFRVPWSADFYKPASLDDRASYIAIMELAVCLGRMLYWVIILIGTLYLPLSNVFLIAFIGGAVASLAVPLINHETNVAH
jgi:MFS family permease